MCDGLHTWMNVVRSDEIKTAMAEINSGDEDIARFSDALSATDLHVLNADLTRTFDAFEEDFAGCDTEEHRSLLKRILICALHDAGCGYCQVRPRGARPGRSGC